MIYILKMVHRMPCPKCRADKFIRSLPPHHSLRRGAAGFVTRIKPLPTEKSTSYVLTHGTNSKEGIRSRRNRPQNHRNLVRAYGTPDQRVHALCVGRDRVEIRILRLDQNIITVDDEDIRRSCGCATLWRELDGSVGRVDRREREDSVGIRGVTEAGCVGVCDPGF
jgi:hypothetical protein